MTPLTPKKINHILIKQTPTYVKNNLMTLMIENIAKLEIIVIKKVNINVLHITNAIYDKKEIKKFL